MSEAATWTEILAVPGVGAALVVVWMFLRYLRELRESAATEAQQRAEEMKLKDAHVERVAAEFSRTVLQISTDVRESLRDMNQSHQSQVTQMHELLRGVAEK